MAIFNGYVSLPRVSPFLLLNSLEQAIKSPLLGWWNVKFLAATFSPNHFTRNFHQIKSLSWFHQTIKSPFFVNPPYIPMISPFRGKIAQEMEGPRSMSSRRRVARRGVWPKSSLYYQNPQVEGVDVRQSWKYESWTRSQTLWRCENHLHWFWVLTFSFSHEKWESIKFDGISPWIR